MLKGLDPILSPQLLYTLREMGHGDEIAIVDGNYPAQEHGRRLVRLDGLELIPIVNAVLDVLPIDEFVDEAIFCPAVDNGLSDVEPIHHELFDLCKKHAPKMKVVPLKGDNFYNRVKACYAIIATSEKRLYGNIILRKGVIYPS